MKKTNDITGALFAFWALLSFIVTFLIIFIPSMICWLIPNPKGQDIFIKIARLWMNVWLWLVGCPLKVYGKENFQKGKTYIVTFNHNSLMDVPLSCPYIPGPNKTIAKSSFAKVPLFGFYYMKGAVLVNRKSELSRKQSYEKMRKVLNQGMHMSIYPEGTRNRTTDPLKKFHDGAFKLAVDTGHSIIPAVIFNTRKVLPPNKSFYFRPTKLEMYFLEPVAPGDSYEELKKLIFKRMSDFYLLKTSGD